MENLYNQEQKLLEKLKQTNAEDQQEAIKRTIGRINDEMKEIENEK